MISLEYLKTYTFYALAFAGFVLSASGSNLRPRCTAGCTKPHTVDGVSKDYEISTGGRNRTYRIHLPSNYNPNTPAPLVLSYHGHGQNMVKQEALSQFSNDGINPNMIAVYPQGLKGAVSGALLTFSRHHHINIYSQNSSSSTTNRL